MAVKRNVSKRRAKKFCKALMERDIIVVSCWKEPVQGINEESIRASMRSCEAQVLYYHCRRLEGGFRGMTSRRNKLKKELKTWQ